MRLILTADGRSPHSHGWILGAADLVDSMLVLSSSAAAPFQGLPSNVDWVQPGPLPRLRTRLSKELRGIAGDTREAPSHMQSAKIMIRHGFEFTVAVELSSQLSRLTSKYRPDLVHCLRLPWEGIAGCGFGKPSRPTVISLWGSDLLTQAASTPLISAMSRRALSQCTGLIADCDRDIGLAHRWGLAADAPTAVVAGNMGLLTDDLPVHVNRNPGPETHYLCTRRTSHNLNWQGLLRGLSDVVAAGHQCRLAMLNANPREVAPVVAQLGLGDRVELHGHVTREEFLDRLSWADVMLSPTISDGVPVSLLEGMFAGCFIIASDLASLRGIVDAPELGILLDPTSQQAISAAMLHATQTKVRSTAASTCPQRILQSHSRAASQEQVRQFYRTIVSYA